MGEKVSSLYAVSIRYPRKPGAGFDFQHWANTHMPLGIETFKRVNGIAPQRVMVQHETFGMNGTTAAADSYITVWLVFDTRAGLEGFMRLHNDTVKSAELTRDFDNYAPLPPAIVLGELTVFSDMEPILARGEALLRAHGA